MVGLLAKIPFNLPPMDSIISKFREVAEYEIVPDYVLVFGVAIILYLVFKFLVPLALSMFEKFAKKTENTFDELLADILMKVRWPVCLLIVLWIARTHLMIPLEYDKWLKIFMIVFATFWGIKVFTLLVNFFVKKFGEKAGPGGSALLPIFAKFINFIIWAIGILFVVSNLGYEITPLITGLGISGIAIALAVQNILSDLLSSVSIYLDKPFKIGDHIRIGKLSGAVKSVGIKTTRIAALDGEELVIPNKEIVESTIQNYKRMKKRRVSFSIGVTYETKKAKLEKVPAMIKRIVKSAKGTEFGRVHFAALGDFSLNFEVVYYVLSNDYEEYMDIQQKINFALIEGFNKEKIEFAYPTQKVFVAK